MKVSEERYVDQSRAAVLLGIPERDLCALSREAGLGHKERNGAVEHTYFTYEELRKICVMSVQRLH